MVFPLCKGRQNQTSERKIAVTTTLLAEIVRELSREEIKTVQIIPPGSCPEHFDISPDILVTLRESKVCIAHDFQGHMGELLSKKTGIKVFYVAMPYGLATPSSFAHALQETAPLLKKLYPELTKTVDDGLIEAMAKSVELEKEAKVMGSDLRGRKAFASIHQKNFCEWLGIEVVATFSRSESVTPDEIEKLIAKGRAERISAIVANFQEGVQYPQMLSEKLGVPLIVLSNFPGAYKDELSFRALVLGNVKRLIDGLDR